MKTLTIVRHAKSSWNNPKLSDRERPLNKRGERDAPTMGQRLGDAGVRPSLIASSPAVRAWTTARVIATQMSYPVEFLMRENNLYLASLHNLLDIVAEQDEGFQSLLIVAHNPGLTDLANFLCPGLTDNLPTAGVVSLNIDQDHWKLHDQPQTELVLHDYPKKER
jgi:phosphohistidine phosphatase